MKYQNGGCECWNRSFDGKVAYIVLTVRTKAIRKSQRWTADFMASLEGRLSALAKAHDLLFQADWRGARLDDLARVQLAPYTSDDAGRVQIEGPPVSLVAEVATPFALVLHELATNAAKYGALSQPSGTVRVTWTVRPADKGEVLSIVWHERSKVPVAEFTVAGLGIALIDQAIPETKVVREFGPDGLICRIELALPLAGPDESGL
jgi:two-component system CheB/CheR fusion protein